MWMPEVEASDPERSHFVLKITFYGQDVIFCLFPTVFILLATWFER